MNQVKYSIIINARPEVVWETITDPRKYEEWTYIFSEGSFFDGGWNQGDSIRFLTINSHNKPEGMISEIAESKYPTYISIRHLGFIMDGVEDTTRKESEPAYENYTLELLNEDQTKFTVDMDIEEEYIEMFEDVWPKAMEKVKEISEDAKSKPMKITIRTRISRPIQTVWEGFTRSEHVTKWNHASDDWHCPEAVNNLVEGGGFDYTMASKDGKVSFHFEGKYTKIIPHEQICYVLDDGREISVNFSSIDGGVAIEETFDAEGTHTLLQQRQGWQAILDSFAKYTEQNL